MGTSLRTAQARTWRLDSGTHVVGSVPATTVERRRWEYRPGSTLFLVWNQNRGSSIFDPAWNGVSDIWGLRHDPQQNVFLVKLNYYLNLQRPARRFPPVTLWGVDSSLRARPDRRGRCAPGWYRCSVAVREPRR